MIFPVVEAAAGVVYPLRGKERAPVRLLRELGFEHPISFGRCTAIPSHTTTKWP
jgi:hypothetical protein